MHHQKDWCGEKQKQQNKKQNERKTCEKSNTALCRRKGETSTQSPPCIKLLACRMPTLFHPDARNWSRPSLTNLFVHCVVLRGATGTCLDQTSTMRSATAPSFPGSMKKRNRTEQLDALVELHPEDLNFQFSSSRAPSAQHHQLPCLQWASLKDSKSSVQVENYRLTNAESLRKTNRTGRSRTLGSTFTTFSI